MTRAGMKQCDGVQRRLEEFFGANPQEELTYADIVVKFGGTYRSAHSAVARLQARGELESVHVIRLRANGIAT